MSQDDAPKSTGCEDDRGRELADRRQRCSQASAQHERVQLEAQRRSPRGQRPPAAERSHERAGRRRSARAQAEPDPEHHRQERRCRDDPTADGQRHAGPADLGELADDHAPGTRTGTTHDHAERRAAADPADDGGRTACASRVEALPVTGKSIQGKSNPWDVHAQGSSPNNFEETTGVHATSAMPHPGVRINQYEMIKMIGEGGMGTVFLARDLRLDAASRSSSCRVTRPS